MAQQLKRTCSRWHRAALAGVLFAGAAASCLATAGCSSSDAPPLAEAEGTVTMNGKPLSNIGVVFFPTGSGPMSSGNTDENGRFVLTTIKPQDGAVVGQHRVAFGAAEESSGEYARRMLPAKYESPQTSQVTAEVVAGQVNQFTFELSK